MRYQILTPPVNNQVATTVIPMVADNSSSTRDSTYYHDLMNKYRIDEQYSKTKSDKDKARKLYQYNHKRYKQEQKSEVTTAIVIIIFIIVVFIALATI